MSAKRVSPGLLLTTVICLLLPTGCSTIPHWPAKQRLTFAVLADPRGQGDTWKNALTEIRDRKTETEPSPMPVELIVVAGDMDPIVSRHEDYQHVFTDAENRPTLLPVIGNHEFDGGGVHFRYARDVLIPSVSGVVRRHDKSCDYYVDHGNVRIVMVDGYTDLGIGGVINDEGRHWVEQVITAAPSSIDHVFVSFHEPAFPRFRHVGDSFDQDREQRNAFWRMLLNHKETVRAVLVGHTHSYYRMRVLDPAGKEPNDPKAFPDEDGGIYQIDAGAAGNGEQNTIVLIQTEGKDVLFRVLQAERGASKPFTEVDSWRIADH